VREQQTEQEATAEATTTRKAQKCNNGLPQNSTMRLLPACRTQKIDQKYLNCHLFLGSGGIAQAKYATSAGTRGHKADNLFGLLRELLMSVRVLPIPDRFSSWSFLTVTVRVFIKRPEKEDVGAGAKVAVGIR
jgi:hypothetical protein